MAGARPPASDLGVRTLSAIVMIAVAGTALWLGGWVWAAFVALVALGVVWEWWGLVRAWPDPAASRAAWGVAGLAYVGLSAATLAQARAAGLWLPLLVMLLVIVVDVSAYFAGRAVGGPKIAPRISPSKTWAGLIGAMTGAALLLGMASHAARGQVCAGLGDCGARWGGWAGAAIAGAVAAIIAQAGDFFESWMKRRADVKDSGTLIPGHGGLFDRVDGLLALCFMLGLMRLFGR